MNKKNMIITGACGSLVIGLAVFSGYEYGKLHKYETAPLVQNTAQAKKINYSDKVSSVVVSEITEDGYAILQFGGGCNGCSMVDVTLKDGVEKQLISLFPNELKGAKDVTEHQRGEHSYY